MRAIPACRIEKRQRALVRDMIGTMVGDVIAETARRVREAGSRPIDEVRAAGRPLAGFSDAARGRGARAQALPLRPPLRSAASSSPFADEAQRVVADLAAAYRADPALLPDGWRRGGDRTEQLRTIGDFIAGMTDRFAIARHEELVGPVNLPAGRFRSAQSQDRSADVGGRFSTRRIRVDVSNPRSLSTASASAPAPER